MPARLGWRKRALDRGRHPAARGRLRRYASPTAGRTASPPRGGGAPDQAAPRSPNASSTSMSLGPASIFAISRDGDELFGQLSGQRKAAARLGRRRHLLLSGRAGEITFAIDAMRRKSELTLHQNGRDVRAARIAELAWRRRPPLDRSVDSLCRLVRIDREPRAVGHARRRPAACRRRPARPKFEVAAEGVDAFSDRQRRPRDLPAQRARQGHRASCSRSRPSAPGSRRGSTPARAKIDPGGICAADRRSPGSFPGPGPAARQQGRDPARDRRPATRRAELRTHEHGAGAKIRRQAAELQAMFNALRRGRIDLLPRRRSRRLRHLWRQVRQGLCGVSPACSGADGKAEDVIFRPDGNDEPGGIAACADEADLKRAGRHRRRSSCMVYNDSGSDIQLFRLDADGKRMAHGTISDNMSSPILTYCRQSVGHRRRVGAMSGGRAAGTAHALSTPSRAGRRRASERGRRARTRRSAGSEDDAAPVHRGVGRGEPDYDRMTPEVAAQHASAACRSTRRSSQGSVRCGPSRSAASPRIGSDIYIAHFANGSAEWRIGLVRNGTIGRIALGPQYLGR